MVVIQNSINDASIDERNLINNLQQVMMDLAKGESELLIRIVDKTEIQDLNNRYRRQNKPTNVLSFPSDLPKEINEAILGDVIICTDIVREEAKNQGKTFNHHLMHIAIHGTLHLFGYNHIQEDEAQIMETLEIKILQDLGIENPYI
ncbi:Metal-dependent hydrolase YbeY, involved in rRNA and/or ribosome maturation and assembly [uncultured Candidatus Thioglobus sp.]|nr:Metal-dependent hydrolase YbeY, involved in rRNA and/or ribosome maturation and assembly [uncultured Candidatus Thioglobus sp.]